MLFVVAVGIKVVKFALEVDVIVVVMLICRLLGVLVEVGRLLGVVVEVCASATVGRLLGVVVGVVASVTLLSITSILEFDEKLESGKY